ncbi:hypothetical protein HNQ08_004321 [Deinococcus humi]|uniref:Uncharacterized protein n=1 Tax=Deinococcus humi TaxID=662880 RepID=A0A7W8JYB0_9DEIO|nr:hypothetical protein [Deinococcus humi]
MGILGGIALVINRFGIANLMRLNGVPRSYGLSWSTAA